MVLILVIIFTIMFGLYRFIYKKNNSIPLILLGVIILIAGLRYNYGADYNNYLTYYENSDDIRTFSSTSLESGYELLSLLFKKLGLGFNTMLIVIAYTSVFLKYKLFSEMSRIPVISFIIYLLMFFVPDDMEQIRSGLAIGISIYSIIYVRNQDYKKFSILMLIAFLFHRSALLFIPVYLLPKIKLSKRVFSVSIVFTILLSQLNIIKLLDFINKISLNSVYLDSKIEAYKTYETPSISMTVILRIIVLLAVYFTIYQKSEEDKLSVKIYHYGLIILLAFAQFPIISIRGTIYFRYMEALMIPNILYYSINNYFAKSGVIVVPLTGQKIKCNPDLIVKIFLVSLAVYYVFNFFKYMTSSTYINYNSI